MRTRHLAATSLPLLLLLLTPASAESCSCRPSGPPCEEAWEFPLIFAGTVIELDQSSGTLSATRVRFRITEALRGTEAGEIDIHLRGSMSGSCDPPFKLGESWLIYGSNRWEGGSGWTTSSCSRTRLLSQAEEDLRYLRLPDKEKPASHITGTVTRWVYDLSQVTGGQSVPVPDVPVVVTGGTTRLEAKTDGEGRYRVPVDSNRVYQVDFAPRVNGLVIRSPSEPVLLRHYRACAGVSAGALYDGRMSGQIVDDHGAPVPFLPITLASSPRLLQQHMLTDAEGRFSFAEVYPAAHDIVPSLSLWQRESAMPALTAAPIAVPPAGRVDTGRLRLPASPKMALVEIVIEDSAGNPAAGARVTLEKTGSYGSIRETPPADATGTFRVTVVAGQRYEVEVWHRPVAPAGALHEAAKVVIDTTGMKPIRVRLARQR